MGSGLAGSFLPLSLGLRTESWEGWWMEVMMKELPGEKPLAGLGGAP